MRKTFIAGIVVTLVAAGIVGLVGREKSHAADEDGSMLAHMVYFTLKDKSADAKGKLVAACKKYLSKHAGTVYFSAGTLAEDLKREVNDRDFDVALHLVFKNRAAHDQYQTAKRHEQFIEENKENWTKVRVFDSVVPQ
jgi:hypothetical protein